MAAAYLQRFTDLPDVRFDVVGVAPRPDRAINLHG